MHMTLDEALQIMNLTMPFTEDELKKSYRKLAKQYHPDYHPGDKEAEETFKKVNEANEFLGKYLKNPQQAKAESQRNASYRYQNAEADRRRQEEEKRREEEKRKREEEFRRAEEARKRQEERQRREVEERKRAEAAQREAEERERFERKLQTYASLDLFNLSGISKAEYITDSEKRDKLDDFYYSIRECYKEVEKYIERYKNVFHRQLGPNPLSKTNIERRKEVKEYEEYIRRMFPDMKTAAKTYFKMYGEYYDYGFILRKISSKDLKEYIFMAPKTKEVIKKQAENKLQEYASLQKQFLDVIEESEMYQIDPDKRARSYYKEISIQQDIEEYVEMHYELYRDMIIIKPGSNNDAKSILNSFYKVTSGDISNGLMSLRMFLSLTINMGIQLYRKCPDIKLFNPDNDYSKVAILAKNFYLMKDFYKLSNTKNFITCYECFKNIKDNPNLHIKTIEDVYKLLTLISNRSKKIIDIKSFNRSITLEELTLLSEEEYQKLVKETIRNSTEYSEKIKFNPDVKDYEEIFKRYPDMFKGMSYQRAMDFIGAKYEYIKRKGLKESPVTLFPLSEEDLNKKLKEQKRKKKIEFIMKHNPEYETHYHDIKGFIDFKKEPSYILDNKSDADLDFIYKQTYMAYVNANHPEIKVTPAYYDKLNEEQRDDLLEDVAFNMRLIKIAKLTQKLKYPHPMTYEEVRNLDGKQLDELEKDLMLKETESFFTSGGSSRR